MTMPERKLEDRLRRCELMIAALVTSDRELDPHLAEEFLYRFSDIKDRDYFRMFFREMAQNPRRGRFLARLDNVQSTIESHDRRFEEIRSTVEGIRAQTEEFYAVELNRIGDIGAAVESVRTDHEALSADAHAMFSIQSLGLDPSRVRMTRFLPVRLYVTREAQDMAAPLIKAIERMLEAYGFEVADDFPAERGSVFKRWFSRSKDALTSEEAKDVARKVKKGAEVAGLDKPMAEVNKTQSEALRNALEIAKDYDDVALQFGTALVVVRTNSNSNKKTAMAITLSPAQAIALENNPDLLHNPATILERLKELCDDHNDTDLLLGD